MASIGALAIPGLGPIIAAAAGTFTGGLMGMAISEHDAKLYEGNVAEGDILMSVHTADSRERMLATEVFADAGAESVVTVSY